MKAKLISVSKPVVEELDNLKDLIVYCARVSNPSNQTNMDTTDKLIKYLLKHKHFSPFEMANCVVEVECPRDIARQILRHRSFSFQEFSQRYADVNALESSFVIREARMQDNNNRQNSVKITEENIHISEWWEEAQRSILDTVIKTYEAALEAGIAKECARVILPEGLTMSRLYINGTIRSWIHYLEVRTESGVTQEEHCQIARLIAEQICKAFPVEQFVK